MLRDILKTNKIGNNHKLYIITGLTIPFFISTSTSNQAQNISLSERTIFRIRLDLTEIGILKKYKHDDFEINIKKLKEIIK
jgi:hypothetical protein